jgi:predicted phosphoadenosine phosphosulfate sulfurtransferase
MKLLTTLAILLAALMPGRAHGQKFPLPCRQVNPHDAWCLSSSYACESKGLSTVVGVDDKQVCGFPLQTPTSVTVKQTNWYCVNPETAQKVIERLAGEVVDGKQKMHDEESLIALQTKIIKDQDEFIKDLQAEIKALKTPKAVQ